MKQIAAGLMCIKDDAWLSKVTQRSFNSHRKYVLSPSSTSHPIQSTNTRNQHSNSSNHIRCFLSFLLLSFLLLSFLLLSFLCLWDTNLPSLLISCLSLSDKLILHLYAVLIDSRMDALPTFTTLAVNATSPQLDTTRRELPEDEDDTLQVTEYRGTAKTYSSDEDACFSDHPSEDPSDLALAVRDESFAPVPLMVGRTYSSSDESVRIPEVNEVDSMVEDVATFGDFIHMLEMNNGFEEDEDSIEEICDNADDGGYASVEDNIEDTNEIESVFTFEVTDPVPTSCAQQLFVRAWNGETSSCGEEVGDIETIPSDEERNDVGDVDVEWEGNYGSIHTLESSEGAGVIEQRGQSSSENSSEIVDSPTPESAAGTTAKNVPSLLAIETFATSNRCITSHAVYSKDGRGNYSSVECSVSSETKTNVMSKTGITQAGERDQPEQTDIEGGAHFKQGGDTKASPGKNRRVFKHFKKLFTRCFGHESNGA